jgi:hypothetical protein
MRLRLWLAEVFTSVNKEGAIKDKETGYNDAELGKAPRTFQPFNYYAGYRDYLNLHS